MTGFTKNKLLRVKAVYCIECGSAHVFLAGARIHGYVQEFTCLKCIIKASNRFLDSICET